MDTEHQNYLYLVPLLCGILFPLTFVITYSMAVSEGDILPLFSYISDTGAYPVSSCVFSFLLSIASFLLGVTVYIRFKQIQAYYADHDETSVWKARINVLGFWLGILASIGVNLVGCFQETNYYRIHFTGAFLAFLGGGLFLVSQAYFTFQMLSVFASRVLGYIRYFLSFMCIILFVVTFTAGTISVRNYTGDNPYYWEKEKGGWTMHVISVVAEWIMAAFLDVYILTFVPEFKKIFFQPPVYKVLAKPRAANNNDMRTGSNHPYNQRVSQYDSYVDSSTV